MNDSVRMRCFLLSSFEIALTDSRRLECHNIEKKIPVTKEPQSSPVSPQHLDDLKISRSYEQAGKFVAPATMGHTGYVATPSHGAVDPSQR